MFLIIPIHLILLLWDGLFVYCMQTLLWLFLVHCHPCVSSYGDLFSSLSILLEFFISLLEREECLA